MEAKTIDYLNTGLIILSFIIAVYIPFELFLFSYAILGPLHYLTEINWLNDKKFFIRSKGYWYIVYICLAVIISGYRIINSLDIELEGLAKTILHFLFSKGNTFLLFGFMFAISLIWLKKVWQLAVSFLCCMVVSLICSFYISDFILFIGIFLPTIIHVYFFTLLFMIYGYNKSKNKLSLFNIFLLVIMPLAVMSLDIRHNEQILSEFIKTIYTDTNLLILNVSIAKLLGLVESENFYVLSKLGIKIQVFIAFTYTYHYLNWFSKTSVIGWGKSLKGIKMRLVLFLWLLSVFVYLYDYKTGLMALFFLSILHVFLEFPLNITTIKELISSKGK